MIPVLPATSPSLPATQSSGRNGGRTLTMSSSTSSWPRTMSRSIPSCSHAACWEPRTTIHCSTISVPLVRNGEWRIGTGNEISGVVSVIRKLEMCSLCEKRSVSCCLVCPKAVIGYLSSTHTNTHTHTHTYEYNIRKKIADNGIRVAVLEKSFAALKDLGVPFSVCLQLQQSDFKLAEANWTARSMSSGFFGQLLLASGVTAICKTTAEAEKA